LMLAATGGALPKKIDTPSRNRHRLALSRAAAFSLQPEPK
jgi:hypothetical protein